MSTPGVTLTPEQAIGAAVVIVIVIAAAAIFFASWRR